LYVEERESLKLAREKINNNNKKKEEDDEDDFQKLQIKG